MGQGERERVCRWEPSSGNASCWESYVPLSSCSDFEDLGYTCVGNWCAATDPGGYKELCANSRVVCQLQNPRTQNPDCSLLCHCGLQMTRETSSPSPAAGTSTRIRWFFLLVA